MQWGILWRVWASTISLISHFQGCWGLAYHRSGCWGLAYHRSGVGSVAAHCFE
jgi:hypothetical protein